MVANTLNKMSSPKQVPNQVIKQTVEPSKDYTEDQVCGVVIVVSLIFIISMALICVSILPFYNVEHHIYHTNTEMHVLMPKVPTLYGFSFVETSITGKFEYTCTNRPSLNVKGITVQTINGTLKTPCKSINVKALANEVMVDIQTHTPKLWQDICFAVGLMTILTMCLITLICLVWLGVLAIMEERAENKKASERIAALKDERAAKQWSK